MNRRQSLKLIGGTAALAASGLFRTAAFAQAPAEGPFKLPPLGYANDALEPHIDAQTMMIHHDRHHAAYVNACNEFAKQVPELGTTPIEKTLTDPAYIPLQIQQGVKNNLGGHWNHTFFWQLMTPGGAKDAPGELKSAIGGSWKDVDEFKDRLSAAGAGRFGSGWAWLVVNKDKKLEIISTANQDTPIAIGAKPVIGVDVWEHAYYLKYQNRRADYLKAWWNTVNWDKAAENFNMGWFKKKKTTARCGRSGPPDERAVQPCGGHLERPDQQRAIRKSGYRFSARIARHVELQSIQAMSLSLPFTPSSLPADVALPVFRSTE